jgi:hypothetical protein
MKKIRPNLMNMKAKIMLSITDILILNSYIIYYTLVYPINLIKVH